jgi:predicted HTH domain antitoxin
MSTLNSIQINLRVPEEVASDLDQLAEQAHATRIDVARQILLAGVAARKRAHALELYRQGRASKSKAAEIAGISLWELMDLIGREETPNTYTLQDAVDEVRRLVAQADTSPEPR